MTGWTQFTVRTKTDADAELITESVVALNEKITYNNSYGNIARVRVLGYGMADRIVMMLEDFADVIESALVASFNDTTNGGTMRAYRSDGDRLSLVNVYDCDEATRWGFSRTFDGLTETGNRAGEDFTLEMKYKSKVL